MARISTEERQEIIIDEAINIIHELGYQSFSIRELSKRVGITEPAIYRHFLNKEDIVLGILSRFSEFDEELFKVIKDKKTPKEKIQNFVAFHFDFLEKHPEMTSVIFAEDMFNQSKLITDKMLKILTKRKNLIKEIFEEAKKNNLVIDLESEELLMVALGFIRMIILEWRLSGFKFSLSTRGVKTVNTIEKLIIKKK